MTGLTRTVGLWGAVGIGIGAIIGTGIFVLIGVAAGLAGGGVDRHGNLAHAINRRRVG